MLCDTLEIRWFFESLDHEKALEVFQRASGFEPVAEDSRTDHYLRLPHSENIAIKQREGRLEHKWLLARSSDIGVGEEHCCEGFGHWRKWSVEAGDAMPGDAGAPDPSNWIAVRKLRWTSPWEWSDGQAQALPEKTERDDRCDVELARVDLEIPGRDNAFTNWTICFESEGPDREPLMKAVFRTFVRSGLTAFTDCAQAVDYPYWLRRKTRS